MRYVDLLNDVIRRTGDRLIGVDTPAVLARVAEYDQLDLDELMARAQRAAQGALPPPTVNQRLSFRLAGMFGLRSASPRMMELVALGVAAFRRAPADLPAGSRLYPEQVHAALALTQPVVVQMDTGEGKTYALLPAVFAFACLYQRVYVICANDYLAHRDASRTSPFWELVGMSHGAALTRHSADWGKRVVYTTLQRVMFKALDEDLSREPPSNPLVRTVLILDEADAVLLDHGELEHLNVLPISSETFDWSEAIRFAEEMTEPADIEVDRRDLTASLTVSGEAKLRDLLAASKAARSPFFLARFAVELSYMALTVVREDVHYCAEGDRLHPIDIVTGRVQRNHTPPWLIPLEHQRGLEPRPRKVTLHALSPSSLVTSFPHVSGLSGTIAHDSVEYLLTYWLPTLRVPPRVPRRRGEREDVVYRTKAEADTAIVHVVLGALADGRPVLVGTQSVERAKKIHTSLEAVLGPEVSLTLLTGSDEARIAEAFGRAGQTNAVTVATQLAGRGVDIRLSEEARSNGGLVLLMAGHATEGRHDRQFLGRGGRQGDPYYAQFFCSLEDELLMAAGGEKIDRMMERLGHEEGEDISHRFVTKAIRRAQHAWRNNRFIHRRIGQVSSQAALKNEIDFQAWMADLRTRQESESPGFWAASTALIERSIDGLLLELSSGFSGHGPVEAAQAEAVVERLGQLLGVPVEALPISPLDIEQLERKAAVERLRGLLRDVVGAAQRHWGVESQQQVDERNDQSARLRVWREFEAVASELVRDPHLSLLPSDAEAEVEEDEFSPPAEGPDLDGQITETGAAAGVPRLVSGTDAPDLSPVLSQASDDLLALPAVEVEALVGQLTSIQRAHLDPESRERIELARKCADEVQEMLARSISALDSDIDYRHGRRPAEVAYWSVVWRWAEHLESRERIRAELAKRGLNALDYYRAISDRWRDDWVTKERSLGTALLRNLVRCPFPELLDELFLPWENSVRTASPEPDDAPVMASPRVVEIEGEPLAADEVVLAFLLESRRGLGQNRADQARTRRLVKDFFEAFPLPSLQTPLGIVDALTKWALIETERGVSRQERRQHKRVLDAGLRYLNRLHRTAAPPTAAMRMRHRISTAVQGLLRPRTMLPILAGFSVVAVFMAGFAVGGIGPTRELSPFLTLLDSVLSAGLFSAGNLVAPFFALPLVLYGVADLFGFKKTIFVQAPLLVLLQLAISVGMAFWIGFDASVGGISLGIAVTLGVFFLLGVSRGSVATLHQRAGLNLCALWLTGTTALLILRPPDGLGLEAPATLLFVGAAATLGWLRLGNFRTLALVGEHVRGGGSGVLVSEPVALRRRVRASAGMRPHVLAFIGSAITYHVAASFLPSLAPGTLNVLVIAVFLFLMLALAYRKVTEAFSPRRWRAELNRRRLQLENTAGAEALERSMAGLRRSAIQAELVSLALIGATLVTIMWGRTMANGFPVSVVVMTLAAVFVHSALDGLPQLWALGRSGFHTSYPEITPGPLPDTEAQPDFAERVKDRLGAAMKVGTVLVLALEGYLLVRALLSALRGIPG